MPNWNNYKNPNMGLLFYKHIYNEDAIKSRVRENVEDGFGLKLDIPNDVKPTPFDIFYNALCNYTTAGYTQIENPAAIQRFTLYTTYPGLLTGSGYMHETKAAGDFKIGYFFDHTTGQPMLPGSSVKGCLRSLFETDVDKDDKRYTGVKSVAAIQFIANEMLQDNTISTEVKIAATHFKKIDEAGLKKVVTDIFGDADTSGTDIFFDSVLDITACNNRKIMGTDFLTPHEDELKNPKPIQFIKVLPQVAFEFRFRFNDNGLFTAIAKKEFFKQLLLIIGIGAKTNVGYGQFKESNI
jgi:CRISPR-associated protein Cmr6